MKFCENCGTLIIPEKEKDKISFICRKCNIHYKPESAFISEKKVQEKSLILVEEGIEALPTAEYLCEKCGNKKAYWWTMQTRSSDEPETRFFRCTKCNYTRREYD
jgi:DNA-directed RNA polymerase subunit M